MLDPDYSPEMPGRLAKLEGAISKQRTVKFEYWSISRDETSERSLNPYALMPDNGVWYVVGHDLERDDIRTFRVSRIRGEIKFATRRERDFRTPVEFDIELYRGRPPWQVGDIIGEARIEVPGETAWWVQRAYGSTGRLEEGVFITDYSSLPQLASWVLRQDGRAVPLEPDELRREVAASLRRVRENHEGKAQVPAREAPKRGGRRDERAPGRPGRAGAVRDPPGAPRLPARRVRRGQGGADPRGGAAQALPVDPGRGARGAPVAPQPRELRRRLLHDLHRAHRRRSCTSTRSSGATRSACRRA